MFDCSPEVVKSMWHAIQMKRPYHPAKQEMIKMMDKYRSENNRNKTVRKYDDVTLAGLIPPKLPELSSINHVQLSNSWASNNSALFKMMKSDGTSGSSPKAVASVTTTSADFLGTTYEAISMDDVDDENAVTEAENPEYESFVQVVEVPYFQLELPSDMQMRQLEDTVKLIEVSFS